MAWQHTMWLQIKQLRIDAPAGTIHPTCQLLVRHAHSAAESVLLISACAAIYRVMCHVHISDTPSSTNIIVELDGLLQASNCYYYYYYYVMLLLDCCLKTYSRIRMMQCL